MHSVPIPVSAILTVRYNQIRSTQPGSCAPQGAPAMVWDVLAHPQGDAARVPLGARRVSLNRLHADDVVSNAWFAARPPSPFCEGSLPDTEPCPFHVTVDVGIYAVSHIPVVNGAGSVRMPSARSQCPPVRAVAG